MMSRVLVLSYNTVRELTILMSENAKQGSLLHLFHMLILELCMRKVFWTLD